MYYPNELILEKHTSASHTDKVDCNFCSEICNSGDPYFAHVWRDHEALLLGKYKACNLCNGLSVK